MPTQPYVNSIGQLITPLDASHQLINGDLYEKLGVSGWLKIADRSQIAEGTPWPLWIALGAALWYALK